MQPNTMKRMLLAEIDALPRLKGKGLCREYLIGRDYAKHRNGRIAGRNSTTVLQFLLEEPEVGERAQLYPGQFDLGNMESSSPATIAAFKAELEPDERYRTSGPENFLRHARESIPALTGHSLDEYMEQDPRKTLKVLKLLYQVNAATPIQLFSYLAPPGGDKEASFEVATSYPLDHDKAVAGTTLLADFTTLVAVELPAEKRKQVEELYSTLRGRVDELENALIGVASQRAGNNLAKFETCLALVREMLERQAPADDTEAKPLFLPFDEQLCLHAHGLEFLNYAAAQRELTTKLTPTGEVTAPGRRMIEIEEAIRTRTATNSPYPELPLSMFASFAHKNEPLLKPILIAYLGHDIPSKLYTKAVPLALKLLELWMTNTPSRGIHALLTDAPVQPMTILAAMATVCHQLCKPTQYRPYWHGQPNDRGNVSSGLEKIDMRNTRTRAPEGLMRFWDHQMKWHGHALHGHLAIYQHRLAINTHIVAALEHPIRRHNVDLLRQRLLDLANLPDQAAAVLGRAGT